MKKNLCLIILFLSCSWHTVNAQDIFINEFSIDSSPQAVELINTSLDSFDISDWYIDDSSGTTYFSIPHNTIIYPNSCLVFAAEFNLNKSTPDTVRLFDSSAPPTSPTAKIIDAYAYNASPGTNLSYSRMPDGSSTWQIANISLGQRNTSLQDCIIQPTPSPTPIPTNTIMPTPTVTIKPTIVPTLTPTLRPTSTPSPSPSPTPVVFNNIYISEAMVQPESGQKEWIELYNSNTFSVNLINWYIDDINNEGASPKQFSLEIPAKGYGVYELSVGIFNNDGDTLRLLNSLKDEVDSLEFTKSESNKTIGRINFQTEELCIQEPSKGLANSSCITPTDVQPTYVQSSVNTPSPTKTPTPTKIILLTTSDQTVTSPTPHPLNNQSSIKKPYNRTFNSASPLTKPVPTSFISEEKPAVLGVTNQKKTINLSLVPYINSFSFSSAVLSILGITACILKLKSKIGSQMKTETVLSKLNFLI